MDHYRKLYFIIDNIAYDASVSIGTQPAYQTIDGDKTSCSKTQGPNVMFQLDLKEMRIATDIYLTGKGLLHIMYLKFYR